MIDNFENTESWEDKAGNTKARQQQLGIAPTRGVQDPEWTPAGVLTNFENRSGAGVDFF